MLPPKGRSGGRDEKCQGSGQMDQMEEEGKSLELKNLDLRTRNNGFSMY